MGRRYKQYANLNFPLPTPEDRLWFVQKYLNQVTTQFPHARPLARLLPFRQARPSRKALAWLMSSPVIYAAGPGRLGWFPGMRAKVLRSPVHERVCENTTVPTVPGGHM
jgi:hypothetical protein